MIKFEKKDDGFTISGSGEKDEFDHELEAMFDALQDILKDGVEEATITTEEDGPVLTTVGKTEEDNLMESHDVQSEHVVAIGYNDKNDNIVVNHDGDEWSVVAALLSALGQLWPGEDEIDERLCEVFFELADEVRENVETGE